MKPWAFKVRGGGNATGTKGGPIKAGIQGGVGALWYEDKVFTVATHQDQWIATPPHPYNLTSIQPNPMNEPAQPATVGKPLRYLSVCSGMEAASVAWHPLGWTPVGFSEIEPFPCAILKHRFPNTPNYGSLTEYKQWPLEPGAIDLLVGGTPCQSFSVAGLRKGLDDPRGNLALVFLGLADKLKPRWIVWENVPGVLSSNGGRDLGSFLGALVQLGYGFAMRVLDAQHFGVPQRRRRVFVVACLGDWRAPAEVLLESDCVRRDIKKGRAKGQGPASSAESGVNANGRKWPADTACTLNAAFGQKLGLEDQHALGGGSLFVMSSGQANAAIAQDMAHTLNATHETQTVAMPVVIDRAAFNQGQNAQYEPHIEETEVMDSLVARGPHAVGQPIPIQDGREMEKNQNGMGIAKEGDPAYTIDTTGAQSVAIPFRKSKRACSTTDNETWVEAEASNTLNNFDLGDTRTTHAVVEPIAFTTEQTPKFNHDQALTLTKQSPTGGGQPQCVCHCADVAPTVTSSGPPYSRTGNERVEAEALAVMTQTPNCEISGTLRANPGSGWRSNGTPVEPVVMTKMAVRRLTPVECERLQGFPDNWSRISWKGKPEDQCPDGPRYKACGNSMAVPVMSWIGSRIANYELSQNHEAK